MYHGFLDTSIPIDENTSILAIEKPRVLAQLEYTSGVTRNIWNTGLVQDLDKYGNQINTEQIRNKTTLLRILKRVNNKFSKKVQKTVE